MGENKHKNIKYSKINVYIYIKYNIINVITTMYILFIKLLF